MSWIFLFNRKKKENYSWISATLNSLENVAVLYKISPNRNGGRVQPAMPGLCKGCVLGARTSAMFRASSPALRPPYPTGRLEGRVWLTLPWGGGGHGTASRENIWLGVTYACKGTRSKGVHATVGWMKSRKVCLVPHPPKRRGGSI